MYHVYKTDKLAPTVRAPRGLKADVRCGHNIKFIFFLFLCIGTQIQHLIFLSYTLSYVYVCNALSIDMRSNNNSNNNTEKKKRGRVITGTRGGKR